MSGFKSRDARERVGQGLSRLLNLVDGMLGQGLKLLVLITTNEPLSKVHPAVSRAGRCAARVEFGLFPWTEASEWLHAHKWAGDLGSNMGSLALADLFARLHTPQIEVAKESPVGFSA